ncbi:lipopolysaccharide biosynthesis protein [Flaviaesturariibacter terrae]
MSEIKKLAGQTMWYGVSSIAARFLNYLLTPYITSKLATNAFGEVSTLYAAIPFLNVIFTYGLETAYFRYAKTREDHQRVYNTASISLLTSTALFTTILVVFRQPLATLLLFPAHPEYLTYSALIIGLDAASTLAFARLRYEGRPRMYALVRVSGILVNIAATYFFLSVCPSLYAADPYSFVHGFYRPGYEVGYLIFANLLQSAISFLLLARGVFAFRWRFEPKLWTEILAYSAPLILAGFAGMINETFDRIMLGWWVTAPTQEAAKAQVGIYGACYKLSILITLFIQAFRMGAEPFFFKQAQGQDPKRTYARVLKFFVIVICFMFLVVALFLDLWKYFIAKPYWPGLGVVPILLLANMFLGVYYNLSIWYKLSNRTSAGAWITLIGAALTLVINYLFIPRFGYYACAWATFFCYGSMMVVSYIWGQKVYRVPYPTKKLIAYGVISVALYGLQSAFNWLGLSAAVNWAFGAFLLLLFGAFLVTVERREFAKLPVVGRFFQQSA